MDDQCSSQWFAAACGDSRFHVRDDATGLWWGRAGKWCDLRRDAIRFRTAVDAAAYCAAVGVYGSLVFVNAEGVVTGQQTIAGLLEHYREISGRGTS